MNWFNSKLASACVLILLLGAAQVALGVLNDDCENARPIGDVRNELFDTRLATHDGPGACTYGPNVWFCYTAPCTGDVTATIEGAYFDTRLAVYNGCDCDLTASDLIECNDDYGDSWLSQVTFAAVAGNRYLIEIGGYQDYTGDGYLNVNCEGQPGPPPTKDNCANAQAVGNVTNLAFDTTEATFDGPGLCMTSPNIWYVYSATCTGEATVSLLGSSYDTMLAVYDGDDCDLSSSDMIACNDDYPPGQQSQITLPVIIGNEYLIEVGGYGSNSGEGVLNISCEPTGQPSKDNCANAQAVGEVKDLAFNTSDATFDGPGLCMTSPNIWYVYTATCTGEATVSLLGSSYDTILAVYEGDDCDLSSSDLIACNDDYPPGYTSQITFDAIAGDEYLIEVGGYGSNTGEGVLNISCEPTGQPSKDNCANAQAVGEVKDLAFDTTNATFDGPGLCMTSPNIWFVYSASCTGEATVSLLGSSYDTMLAVYEGDDCDLTSSDMIACNDDYSPGYSSQITFDAIAGDEYLIEIGGYGSNTGQGILNISCEPGAAADVPDLGDAPDSTNNYNRNMTAYPSASTKANYPTVYNDGSATGPYGPAHLNDQLVAYLGKSITRETEADTGADEDGVNNIRPSTGSSNNDGADDGVLFPLNLPACRWTTFDYIVNVIDPDVDLWVNVWLDWNRDGDWDDTLECAQGPAPEWAVQNQLLFDLAIGSNQITAPAVLSWHPASGPKEIWMRITLSEQPWKGGSNPAAKGNAGSGPQGKYLYGETEDYYFTPDVSYTICQDFNGDGVVNTDDLVDFTAEWLENCPD
jgi:hypothetical protein